MRPGRADGAEPYPWSGNDVKPGTAPRQGSTHQQVIIVADFPTHPRRVPPPADGPRGPDGPNRSDQIHLCNYVGMQIDSERARYHFVCRRGEFVVGGLRARRRPVPAHAADLDAVERVRTREHVPETRPIGAERYFSSPMSSERMNTWSACFDIFGSFAVGAAFRWRLASTRSRPARWTKEPRPTSAGIGGSVPCMSAHPQHVGPPADDLDLGQSRPGRRPGSPDRRHGRRWRSRTIVRLRRLRPEAARVRVEAAQDLRTWSG